MDVWGTLQPAHGYSLSKRAAVEAGAEAEGELGQLWSFGEDPLSWSEVAARGKEGLGNLGTSGVIQLFLPWLSLNRSFQLLCTCNVLEVHLFCGVPELGAFLCTSSGTSRHIPVVFSHLVVLCCW